MKPLPRFVQIAVSDKGEDGVEEVYALDETGTVHHYDVLRSGWMPLSDKRLERTES